LLDGSLGQQHRRRHRSGRSGPADRYRHHRPGPGGRGVRLIADIFPISGFRGWVIAVTLIGMGLLLIYPLWRVLSLRRNPSPKEPENLTQFYGDEDLEGPRLERALGWSLIFVMVVALALP